MPSVLGVILAGGLSRRMGGGDKPLLRLGGRTLLDHVADRLGPQCGAGLVLSANGDPGRFAGFSGPILADGLPGNPGPLAGILAALDHAAACGTESYASTSTRLGPIHSAPAPSLRGEAEAIQGRDISGPAGAAGSLRSARDDGERTASQDEGAGRITHVVSVPGDTPFLPLDLVARLAAAQADGDARIAVAASGERAHYAVAFWPLALRHDLRAALVERDERRLGAFIARHGAVQVAWPAAPVDPFLNVNAPDDLAAAETLFARPDR